MNFLNQLLNYYNITLEEYEEITKPVDFTMLPDPYKLTGMKDSVALVKRHVSLMHKIVIYGDYDCDGVMSTSILVRALKALGNNAGYYIPSRYLDGYGLNMSKAQEIVEKGYHLVITVDNGIVAFEPVEYLKAHDVDVIVLDHHEKQDVLPVANAIIHQDLSSLEDIKTSAGFLSFLFASALLNKYDPKLLILGAISLVSDMMPLVGYNRIALRLAIETYKYGMLPALDLLKDDVDFDELGIGMKIAPKVNAVGRMIKNTNVNRTVLYFTTDDLRKIRDMHSFIETVNDTRKERVEVASELVSDIDPNQASIVELCDCEEGIIGIIANKLLNAYQKPVVVFAKDSFHDGILKGSARSRNGFSLIEFFETIKDITSECGGHHMAGGVTLKEENLPIFKERFEAFAKKHPFSDEVSDAIDIELSDITLENYKILHSFSPFGEGWRAPDFRLSNFVTSTLKFVKNDNHILLKIAPGIKLVGFNFPKHTLTLDHYDFIGKIEENTFNGFTSIQFRIETILKSK